MEATGSPMSLAVAKSFTSNIEGIHEKRENVHRILTAIQSDSSVTPAVPDFMGRNLEDSDLCDSKFIMCLDNDKCRGCFDSLAIGDVDWTGLAPGTACDEVIGFLTKAGHCENLNGDIFGTKIFCNTFESCVVWTDDDDYGFDDDDDLLDCEELTDCYWEGMHSSWIGDGTCHDNLDGCYNTEVCGFDGGDCCADTCEEDVFSTYNHCGLEGYACKDPASDYCDGDLSTACPTDNSRNSIPAPSDTKCGEEESKYRLVMFDSFGDGWDSTTLTIQAEDDKSNIVFKGGLSDGFESTEYVCLSKNPQCYNARTQGGTWGVEISWEIRPMSDGAPSIAGGGSPGDCDFSVAGDVCDKTCDSKKPNVDPSRDPEYKEFKDLYSCIESKCVVQLGACEEDTECNKCFDPDAPDYCYGVEKFVAVVDCTMCSCTDKSFSDFCTTKSGPGQVTPPAAPDKNVVKDCTPKETMDGTQAIMDYSSCANLDSVSLLVTDFDQNNFGQLDAFETCAHSFRDEENHGGRTALSCMQILKNAITNPITDSNKKAPKEAISALASSLYDHGASFCDCSKKASDACPLCPSFMNFKTILYESIDACQSLDAIDCDSWSEFWRPCKDNLEAEYGSSDFSSKDQCEYVKNDCGNAGPFPAFRRLDCEDEISEESWDFYKDFAKKCLKGSDGVAPTLPPFPKPPPPKPTPVKPQSAPTAKPYIPSTGKPTPKPYIPSDDKPTAKPDVPSDDKPTAKPYVPSGDKPTPKPYIPSDANVPSTDDDDKKKKKTSHWFRNMVIFGVLVAGAYYIWKKRYDGFNFMQYRRRFGRGRYGMVSTSGIGESEMYGNLNSSTTFEPPSLPPAPHMMNPNPYPTNPNPNMMMSGP
eukprot:CAMPEP_0116126648 /NCGR_PEP_ID=MMETSP0329-20121206/6440_1 /TAXON_ID=697910 /ORGANISM="Pseudo-nitzschia arenysensis, Strain B593" /LENGTH=867 /DNA_ID=CAMNT_0003620737 /DNA_START=148 /DNA_END=2751 /DNA_ORIENTATION=+